jgi:IS30 family transposase
MTIQEQLLEDNDETKNSLVLTLFKQFIRDEVSRLSIGQDYKSFVKISNSIMPDIIKKMKSIRHDVFDSVTWDYDEEIDSHSRKVILNVWFPNPIKTSSVIMGQDYIDRLTFVTAATF